MSCPSPTLRFTMLGLVAVLLGTTGQAYGAASAGASIRLHLTVPIVCRVAGIPLADQVAGTSTIAYSVNALCNSPRGYQILALHDAESSAGWAFRYNGVSIAASADGRTILDAADHPINETATLEVTRDDEAPSQARVQLMIEAR